MMRRVIVLALLLGGLRLIAPLGDPGPSSQWLLTFGFLILAAYSVGELATTLRLPKIVGYLAAGLLFGPRALNVVTEAASHRLGPVSSLAIALIAFLAGAELRWSEVKERSRTIMRILTVEMSLTFVVMLVVVLLAGTRLPFIQGDGAGELVAFAVLFASIAVVHSPAVTMALLSETKAGGPVARTTLGVVLVSDVVVVLLFSGALAFSRWLYPPTGLDAIGAPVSNVVWEIGGAVIVGAALGGVVALYLRWIKRELFLFALLVAFFGATIARMLHTETLLTLLTAGFVAENVSAWEDGEAFRHAMERAAAPVFVVFFALAGAELAPETIARAWYLVVPLVLLRIGAIQVGSWLGGRWAGSPVEGRYVWMGLISQAGVGIGLAGAVAQAYPLRGGQLKSVFLAIVAINQVLGPILFRQALSRSGEVVEGPEATSRPAEPPVSVPAEPTRA
jgi:Kef-type K+ transport system membrane component KefB